MPKAKAEKEEAPETTEAAEKTEKPAKKPRAQKPKKDPNQPKKPCGAYIFFCNEKRPDVKKDHPDWGVAQIGKELGAQWKVATEESKKVGHATTRSRRAPQRQLKIVLNVCFLALQKHFAQAEKDKERYTKEMQA